jgi:glycosyltransferase involved in cell wall biosynthesis
VGGIISRIAPEKNIAFLCEAVSRFLEEEDKAYFVAGGGGPSLDDIAAEFQRKGLQDRLVLSGALEGADLVNAYHAMDVFAFASQTETQGIVLTEAMASGAPVVAVDAPGVREVVDNGENGILLASENENDFVDALKRIFYLPKHERQKMQDKARQTARKFSLDSCAERALTLYDKVIRKGKAQKDNNEGFMEDLLRRIKVELDLLASKTRASGELFNE